MIKLALAQMKMDQDITRNYEKSITFLKRAASLKADLILFPEIQLTPFFPQYEKKTVRAMYIDDPYVMGICQACHDNHIFASLIFILRRMISAMI